MPGRAGTARLDYPPSEGKEAGGELKLLVGVGWTAALGCSVLLRDTACPPGAFRWTPMPSSGHSGKRRLLRTAQGRSGLSLLSERGVASGPCARDTVHTRISEPFLYHSPTSWCLMFINGVKCESELETLCLLP